MRPEHVNAEQHSLVLNQPVDLCGLTAVIANTIDYSKIAEARVMYGGRGVLTDMQQPRYGVQLFNTIYPI